MIPIIKATLEYLDIVAAKRMFTNGSFADKKAISQNVSRVVILCGLRAETRKSMYDCSAHFFPGSPCFDFFALYYFWVSNIVKRNCNQEEFAATLCETREEQTILNVDAVNTNFCTLNCKECDVGTQYRTNKKSIPCDELIHDLDKLTRMRPISYCNILGGEPLLNKELPQLLLHLGGNSRVANITVSSNGTIVPDGTVLKAMREASAIFRLSDYGPLSSKKKEFIEKASAFSVPCYVYPKAETWMTYGALEPRNRTDRENEAIAKSCCFGTKSLFLYDGKFYCCCRTLFANAKQYENEAVQANILNIRDTFTQGELDKIVTGENLYRMCDYCDYPMAVVPPAEQMARTQA